MSGALADVSLILTCEHATNQIPAEWRFLFRSRTAKQALRTHRGYDIGAIGLAERLSRRLSAPLVRWSASRLLIDANRSISNRSVLSEFTRGLSDAEKQKIAVEHYAPQRALVEGAVRRHIRASRRVVHISVHSFTPVMRGVVRRADVGLLYDPSRVWERALCDAWLGQVALEAPALRLRRNYPYLGTSDGHVTSLRRKFPASRYVGIELEVNQGILAARGGAPLRIADVLATSLLRLR